MDGISIILCRHFSNTVEKNSVYDREQNLVGYLLLRNERKKYFKASLPHPYFFFPFKLFLSDIWFVLISFCFVVAFSCFRGNLINFKIWICCCCFWFLIFFFFHDFIHGFIFEARSFYLLQRFVTLKDLFWYFCFYHVLIN